MAQTRKPWHFCRGLFVATLVVQRGDIKLFNNFLSDLSTQLGAFFSGEGAVCNDLAQSGQKGKRKVRLLKLAADDRNDTMTTSAR